MMKLILMNLMLMMNFKYNFFKMFLMNFIFILMFFMVLMFNFNKKFNMIFYVYSMDYISFYLILLTNWIIILSINSSLKLINLKLFKMFLFLMSILNFFFMMFFISMNMFMFYIYFEICLIPILYLIMGWGNQVNRIQASIYMMFYTLFGSFPLFFYINYIYMKMNLSSNYLNFLMNFNNFNFSFLIYLMMLMAFLIKLPMYFLHLWLPKAHVEAPISGSMILAGIMLKMGSYGILRLMFNYPFLIKINNYLLILSLIGSLYSSMLTMNQLDLKIIVAYSSIIHMTMMLSMMMTLNFWAMKSSIILMVSHGLCASAMFFIVNIVYERTYSRNMLINKGLLNISPILMMMWFLIYSNNFSSPPSLNLFSEIFLVNSLMNWSKLCSLLIILIMFINTCFSIFLFSKTQHGYLNKNLYYFKLITIQEIHINFLHWFPLNMMFLMINLM